MHTNDVSLARALEYIDDYWERLVRHNVEDTQTLIGLPYPYLVPGDGEMFQEMYYWDSFFMGLGLVDTKRENLIVGMTHNLASLFKRFGVIPNASRYYFLSRSQPPFFTKMIRLAYSIVAKSNMRQARGFLREMALLAEAEHETVWLGKLQPHHRLMHAGLSRYFDINFLDMLASCESGWDHSTRCEDRWMQHLPIDLNAILYAREIDLSQFWQILGDSIRSNYWRHAAINRAETINRLMWDEEEGFYFDFDLSTMTRNPTPSLAGFFPLWAGLASTEQAKRIVEAWLPRFSFEGGLVTALDQQDGRQWAYPNGWAPLQWIVAEGLISFGYENEARQVRQRWTTNCLSVFEKTGVMWEKYNVVEPGVVPEGGLYGSVPGFGWTNAVFVDFTKKLTTRGVHVAESICRITEPSVEVAAPSKL